jgi:hypothetical protein
VASTGYKLVQLANGARGIHSLADGETMHPVTGPDAESVLLYVNQLRLAQRIREFPGEFVIWDVGLGGAANALAVLRATRHLNCVIRIISFDHTLEPLQFALNHAGALGYFDGYESRTQTLLERHRVSFQDAERRVEWEFQPGDFPRLLARLRAAAPARFADGCQCAAGILPSGETEESSADGIVSLPAPHAIMFDPFSPAKNPAMWTLPMFENLFRLLNPARPCALATYSRSTMTRAALLLSGFHVAAGRASGGKEETTIAGNTPELIGEPLDRKWLERARRSHSAEPLREPVYRQAPLVPATWAELQRHRQFQ